MQWHALWRTLSAMRTRVLIAHKAWWYVPSSRLSVHAVQPAPVCPVCARYARRTSPSIPPTKAALDETKNKILSAYLLRFCKCCTGARAPIGLLALAKFVYTKPVRALPDCCAASSWPSLASAKPESGSQTRNSRRLVAEWAFGHCKLHSPEESRVPNAVSVTICTM